MEKLRKLVDDLIEAELARQVEKIGRDSDSLLLLAEVVEYLFRKNNGLGYHSGGLRILVPILQKNVEINNNGSDQSVELKLEDMLDGVVFASNYYYLRDLIWYSFALSNSISWLRTDRGIEVKVNDRSIFRQYLAEVNTVFLNSTSKSFALGKDHDEILSLLVGTVEFDFDNPSVVSCLDYLAEIRDIKIRYYFSYLPDDSVVDIDGYTYAEFLVVYKELLLFSLYRRYYSEANNLTSVISIPFIELRDQICEQVKLPHEIVNKIIKDICDSSECSLILNNSHEELYLLSSVFTMQDVIGNRFRLMAGRNSDKYSSAIANIVADKLVDDLKNLFNIYSNFRVLKEVKLDRFSTLLPDIDLLAISYEPSMGFHVLMCEVKNPIPANWAKFYLRSVGDKGYLTKALDQAESISKFFASEEGALYLRQLALDSFSHLDIGRLFPNGFCIVISQVVITSQSVGMFYADERLAITNDDIFRHVVENCDGDINYILGALRGLAKTFDESISVAEMEIVIEGHKIYLETFSPTGFITFPPHQYLSIGGLEKLEKEAAETGYSFINTIERPENASMAIYKLR